MLEKSHRLVRLLAPGLLLGLAGACASRAGLQTTRLTSAELGTSNAEEAAAAVRSGAYQDALSHSDQAVALSPENPWGYYDRAVALHHLGRTDAAIAAYREAEAHFGNTNRWGKGIAIYGQARTLDDAGRCDEARATYGQFAAFMRQSDPRASEMAIAYGKACQPARTTSESRTSAVATAVVAHDYRRALALADAGVVDPDAPDPWLHYNRGVALVELGRTDEGIGELTVAERGFGTSNPWARSLAVYGRARALDSASRCADARRAYEEYAELGRPVDPTSATTALHVAHQCKER